MPHLFEFTDQAWVPVSARKTFFEILDLCNSGYRSFNRLVANQVVRMAREYGVRHVYELGAGRAPITRCLAEDQRASELMLIPCDLVPAKEIYRDLEEAYPGRVRPIYSSINFTHRHDWKPDSLLVFCASFHHIPPRQRSAVIRAVSDQTQRVAVFEPIKKTLLSILLTFFAMVPAMMLPIFYANRPGKLRRAFWCWLFPVVPAMFLWDSVVSCLRQWTSRQWESELRRLIGPRRDITIQSGWHSQIVLW